MSLEIVGSGVERLKDCVVCNENHSQKRELYILRRNAGGIGGAEIVVSRFLRMFSTAFLVEAISEEKFGARSKVLSRLMPSWWRPVRYTRQVNRCLMDQLQSAVVLSLERGPKCTIYRAGDGAHNRWLELKGDRWWWANPANWISFRLERRSLVTARAIIANSKMVQRDLGRFHPDCRDKMRVIHNGVDQTRFTWSNEPQSAVRARLGWKEEGEHMLLVGSGPRKGIATAILLLARRASRSKGSLEPLPTLHIVGSDGPSKYQKLMRQLDVCDLIKFHGPRNAMEDWYHAADVMVLPTVYDPCSNATLEALACGCPVITTDTNGASEAIAFSGAGVVIDLTSPDFGRVEAWMDTYLHAEDRQRIAASMADWTQELEAKAYIELVSELTVS